MKKLFLFAVAAFAMLATSCSKDADVVAPVEKGTVTFAVATPEMGTRAIADGTTATTLHYAVYDENWNHLEAFYGFKTFKSSTTVNFELIDGKVYNFIFWAQNGDAPYSFDPDTKSMTIDYDGIESNVEAHDAFYATVEALKIKSGIQQEVKLYRPFAQINIATSDWGKFTASEETFDKSEVEVYAYDTLDLVSGNVSGGAERTFTMNTMVTEAFAYDGTNYKWLSMNYILVDDKELVQVTFNANNTDVAEKTWNNVPVERNYRTNILGDILTSDTQFNVIVVEDFMEPDNVVDADGENLQQVADGVLYDSKTKTFMIQDEDGLKWFANAVDGATRTTPVDTANGTFKGYTVELVADIALANAWTPIAGAKFVGTFDGKGHTISNLNITKTDKGAAGLFASAKGVIKNLTIENVNINAHYKAGAIVGDGLCARIENCHVDGGSIVITPLNKDDGNHAGGIVGYLSAESSAWVKDCSVKNLSITAYRDVAAVVGTANGNAPVVSGNYAENVDVLANQLDAYVEAGKDANAGEIVGRKVNDSVVLEDNSFKDVNVSVLVVKNNVLEVPSANVYSAVAKAVTGGNTFEGKTIKLVEDIDLSQCKDRGNSNSPIGDDAVFKGTFDGDGHTIKNLYQSGWDFGYEWGIYGSIGLFSNLESATVKNVTLEGFEAQIEGGDISFVAGSATGDCVFENITIKNGKIGTYNNGIGGIIGWSGAGNYTFKNITIGSDVVIGGLWGSFDSSVGGIVGQAEPGATYNFENVEISCRLDVYNDCTASYDYYLYRMCGMIVGRCEATTTINGVNYPDLSKYNMTFNNVVVNYGDWMNYHYCEPTPGHNGGRGMRVEPGFTYGGLPEDYDHSQCTDNHYNCIPFDQLIGGAQYAVRGLREVDGVTVNYPASFVEPVADATELKEALNKGMSVVLTEDIDYGTTQLALTGSKVDLNGHTLTTDMTYGGISMKDGASIMNGVIEHTTTVAAIKAFNVGSIENVTIRTTCQTANKTVTGIAIQQGGHVGTIKNVTIEGVSQGIEVGYQATVDLIEEVNVVENTNGTAEGIALVINGGKVVKATKCSFKGEAYGVKMHLKGVFDVALELEDCDVEGGAAAIVAYDEKGISNTSGSLVLTYDAATVLTGGLIWDFEDECKGVVTLNQPE